MLDQSALTFCRLESPVLSILGISQSKRASLAMTVSCGPDLARVQVASKAFGGIVLVFVRSMQSTRFAWQMTLTSGNIRVVSDVFSSLVRVSRLI